MTSTRSRPRSRRAARRGGFAGRSCSARRTPPRARAARPGGVPRRARGTRGGRGDFAPEPEFVEEAFADAAAADAFFSEYVDGSDERYSPRARRWARVRARDPGSMKTPLGGADERRRTMSLPSRPRATRTAPVRRVVRAAARAAPVDSGDQGRAVGVRLGRRLAHGRGGPGVPRARRGSGPEGRRREREREPGPGRPGGSSRRSAAKPPIFTLPVFLTPDADLHAELTARRASWTPSLCSTSARRRGGDAGRGRRRVVRRDARVPRGVRVREPGVVRRARPRPGRDVPDEPERARGPGFVWRRRTREGGGRLPSVRV